MSENTLSLGQQANFHAAVIKALPRTMTPADTLAWERNGEKLANALASALCPRATPIPPSAPTITVDYSQTLEQMIAAGHYNWVNDNITQKNFPFSGCGVVELETKLFHFNHTISSEDAVSAIEADGWQVAKIEHLLSFGAKNPEEQRKYPIVALGSSARVGGNRSVPILRRDGSERSLGLYWWSRDWYVGYRLLVVRPVQTLGSLAA